MISQMKITSIGLFFLFLSLSEINAENICTGQTTCINIRRCPIIIKIAREQSLLSLETIETIRKLRCGTEGKDPMICCILQNTSSLSMIIESLSKAEDNIPNPPDVTKHPNLRLLDHQACGHFVPPNNLSTSKTHIFDYPWMVLLVYEVKKEKPEFHCGGTIISSRYILTAAHCFPADISLISVGVSARNINKKDDCNTDLDGHEVQCSEIYQYFGIESIHPHPEFSRTSMQNDIGLIRLNDTIDFSPFSVKPICLPFGSAATLNQRTATMTSWDMKTDQAREDSRDAPHTSLSLVSNERCKEIYKNFTEIWYKQLCASGPIRSCIGDGGKPLQASGIYNGIVRTIQYGVVSFGLRPCGRADYPTVYTKVSYFMDWILDTMRD